MLVAVLALGAGLAGCGGSPGGGSPRATGSAPAGSPPSATTTTTTTPGTTTTSTTTAALPGAGKPAVTIGDKNYGEQFVLGQLYLQALRAQGFKVNINQGIGPTSVVLGSLKRHTLAMYPEYLNVINETFQRHRHPAKTLAGAYASASNWATQHGLVLLAATPFSDTTGIAVTDAYAAENHLRTLGDLLHVANTLVLGGALQFKAGSALAKYGVAPLKFTPLAVGAQYTALDSGAVQAAYVTTTDGELATGDYRVLGDPENVFWFGNVVPVVTQKAASEEGPAFTATIDRVDRTLTLATMRQLNYAVDIAKLTPASVAQQYLQTHGLLTPLPSGSY
ncbi:MAG TPA: glycine betaine ABC transporter substrate-binding protein [Solirubrobacteraceae bacterium]|nr:glycine betaine ABC transporter substrate-binding protein [Solirubrobacteraceae bacterium]